MGIDVSQRLHWSQRIAIVRHNLHAARRTSDFTFFKTLQAHALVDGTDHVAILHSTLGNEADSVLSTLDNLNAGIAYVHQDAFKAVYDSAKSTMYKVDNSPSSKRSLLRVDICQQRDMSDHAIDKTANSAIQLIQAQPVNSQDAVANAWISGATIISDAVCVCIKEMDYIEDNLNDSIRLEYSWSCTQSSVDAAISALRGIFSLMERSSTPITPNPSRKLSLSSTGSDGAPSSTRSRTSSNASAFQGLIKRAFSHSNLQPPPVPKTMRSGSLPFNEADSRGLRLSMSAACPTRISIYSDHPNTSLSTIPPTPNLHETSEVNPFKGREEYFAFDMEKECEIERKYRSSPSPSDVMQLESLDPLYTPPEAELIKAPMPLTLRRLPESFAAAL